MSLREGSQREGDRRAVLTCGGWAHPAAEVRGSLVELLRRRGFEVDVVESAAGLTSALDDECDLLVVASCWFTMAQDRYTPDQRSRWAVPVDLERQRVLSDLIDGGTALLALHTAVICFDEWPGWRTRLGGGWNWARSNHPPPAPMNINSCGPKQAGVTIEPFTVVDEEYRELDLDAESEVVARSDTGDPLMWINQTAGRRVAVDVLGHGRESLDNAGHRAAIDELLDWLLAS